MKTIQFIRAVTLSLFTCLVIGPCQLDIWRWLFRPVFPLSDRPPYAVRSSFGGKDKSFWWQDLCPCVCLCVCSCVAASARDALPDPRGLPIRSFMNLTHFSNFFISFKPNESFRLLYDECSESGRHYRPQKWQGLENKAATVGQESWQLNGPESSSDREFAHAVCPSTACRISFWRHFRLGHLRWNVNLHKKGTFHIYNC